MDTVHSTTFYAIYSDLRTEEFVSKEHAFKAGVSFVLEERFGIVRSGNYSNKEYAYTFFNRQGEAGTSIQVDGWDLEISVGSDNFYQMIIIGGKVTDPLGKFEFLGPVGQAFWGVEKALEVFKKMVPYESLQNYALSLRVAELEAENSELRGVLQK